jgi:hypothetical protein
MGLAHFGEQFFQAALGHLRLAGPEIVSHSLGLGFDITQDER